MRDWSALVHRHLASVRVDERRRREISAELAAHLEDAYDQRPSEWMHGGGGGCLRDGTRARLACACSGGDEINR